MRLSSGRRNETHVTGLTKEAIGYENGVLGGVMSCTAGSLFSQGDSHSAPHARPTLDLPAVSPIMAITSYTAISILDENRHLAHGL